MGWFGKSNEERIEELEGRLEDLEEASKTPVADMFFDVIGKTLTAPLSGMDEVLEKVTPKR